MIIDCGSNIGMSVLYFKWLYPGSKVIAFEPDLSTCRLLERNVRENKLNDVEIHNKALSDRKETVTFYSKKDAPGSLLMSTVNRNWQGGETASVEAVPLSTVIDRPVDFLKMDIEGAEDAVIAEMDRSNKMRLIKEMVIEYHHHIDPERDHLSRILATLEKNGFGYQLRSFESVPFKQKRFQDILIYAYQKNAA